MSKNSNSNEEFNIYQAPKFEEKFESLAKNVRNATIKKLKKDIQSNPYSPSKNLSGNLKGKRETYIGKEYRLIFSICEECREKGYTKFNPCEDCEEKGDNSIVLWVIHHKDSNENLGKFI